ncbi:hypothetical protein ACS0TY_020957 [Phlomoides rotata]
MFLENINDFGHSNGSTPLMLIDGISSELSPQSVQLHQDFERSQNYQIGFSKQDLFAALTILKNKERKIDIGHPPIIKVQVQKKRQLIASNTIQFDN